MRVVGILLAAISLGIGIGTILKGYEVPFGFFLLLAGSLLILIDDCSNSVGIPKMTNPPKPPKKCICNDIEKHSSGGRCEACHSNKFDSKGINIPQIPKDRIGCSV